MKTSRNSPRNLNLLFVNKVSPQLGGGAELRLKHIAAELSRNGHTVTVLCGQTRPREPRSYRFDGVLVLTVRTLPDAIFRWRLSFYASRLLFYVASIPVLARLLRSQHWDYVIDDLSPLASAAFPISRLGGVPCLATVHEAPALNWIKSRGLVAGCAGIIALAALKIFRYRLVITVSKGSAERLRELGLRRVAVIPNGLIALVEEQPASSSDMLVMVGRLVPQKGHLTAIQAFSEIVRQVPSLRLVIVGDGPYRNRIQQEIRKHRLGQRVELRGTVDEKEKWALLRSALLFLFPSEEEGFGIALLEAMSAGLPVVCSNLEAFNEFFEDGYNGIAVPPADANRLAEAVISLLENPNRMKEMSERNKLAARDYSWPKLARQLEKILAGHVEISADL